jgi:hypothetical protein
MFGKELNVVQILQIGVIGLGFLLAVLAYNLLTKEQKQSKPRADILKSVYVFMSFSVVLCIIGIISQLFDSNSGNTTRSTSEPNSILYNYFPYTSSDNPLFCNNGVFQYSEQEIDDVDTNYIQGDSTATLMGMDNRSIAINVPTHGFKNPYFLKMAFPTSVAFLENKNRVYQGYVFVEYDVEAGLQAAICPMVSSSNPSDKGLSPEEAKEKWPILKDSCQPLASIRDIHN